MATLSACSFRKSTHAESHVGGLWGRGAHSAAWHRRAARPSVARNASKARRRCASRAKRRSPQATSAGPARAASEGEAAQCATPAWRSCQAQAVSASAAAWQGAPLARRVLGRMGAACHGRWADVVVRGRMHLRPPLPQSDGVPQAELHGWHRVFISLRLPLVACAPCFYNVLSRMLHWFCFWRPEAKTHVYKSQ